MNKTYVFRLQGNDWDILIGRFTAKDEQQAWRRARTACNNFELDGWFIYCETTSTRLPLNNMKLDGQNGDTLF
jgi:hypothetical protein